jgi:hypothetical protein
MTINAGFSVVDSKSHATDRGSPHGAIRQDARRQDAGRTGYAPLRPRDFLLLPDSAVEATLAMHEAWARNWGLWNQYCKETYGLIRPFYMFPLEMTQYYFAYLWGCPQCIGEPVGKREAECLPGERLIRAEREIAEELEQAMDVATGACTELWCEIVELERAALAA